jgi:hypothetical protein
MFLIRVAPGVKLARAAPGRQPNRPDAQQLADPRGELGAAWQAVGVAGPQRLLGRQPVTGLGRVRILEPAVGVGHRVAEEIFHQVESAGGGVAAWI